MLAAAVLVPDTALLVPGAAGRRDVAAELRDRTLAALRGARGDAHDQAVVVVAPADERRTDAPVELVGTVPASLAAAGVPDRALAEVPLVTLGPRDGAVDAPVPTTGRPPSVASAVALHLLDAVGRRDGVRVVEVPRPGARAAADPRDWSAFGRDLVRGDEPVVLVVVGSGSGRHGPDAPLAEEPDALEVDALLVRALTRPDDAGLAVLADGLAPQRAARHAVSGWLPWRVLAGATAPDRVVADVAAPVLLGAQHVVGTWRVTV